MLSVGKKNKNKIKNKKHNFYIYSHSSSLNAFKIHKSAKNADATVLVIDWTASIRMQEGKKMKIRAPYNNNKVVEVQKRVQTKVPRKSVLSSQVTA